MSYLKPVETSATAYRFAVPVEAKTDVKLTIIEAHVDEARVALAQIGDEQLALMVKGAGDAQSLVRALDPIVQAKGGVAAIAREIAARQGEIRRISDVQGRVRENMKSLKGTPEEQQLVRRYAAQLNQQEDRLETLRRETADLDQKLQRANADLARVLDEMTLDVALDR